VIYGVLSVKFFKVISSLKVKSNVSKLRTRVEILFICLQRAISH